MGLILKRVTVGMLASNSYIVGDEESKEAILIDAGDEPERLLSELASSQLKLKAIVATHGHFDHVLAVDHVRNKTGAPFYLHGADAPILASMQQRARMLLGLELGPPPLVDKYLKEGDVLTVGRYTFEVLHTPGHSPGSICLIGNGLLFSGDTLFAGSIGRTDTPGGNFLLLAESVIKKLFALPDATRVYPGHGPDTTIGDEKSSNLINALLGGIHHA
jgi:glyoxylase-like metal-dependent hydrolase (beta-lactamase superfamily II)